MKILQTIGSYIISFKNWFLKRPLFIKIILVVFLIGSSWYIYTRIKNTSESVVQYQTAKVEKGNLVVSTTGSGQVSTANSTSVSTGVSGVVSKVFVTNDQYIQAGTPLVEVELDRSSQQQYSEGLASYQSAKNILESARATQYSLQAQMFSDWNTFMKLAESNSYKDPSSVNRNLAEFHIPQKEWLAAQAQYKNQQNVINQAQTALNSAWLSYQEASPVIYAPISGTITGFSLQVGTVISPESSSSDATTATSQKIASIKTNAKPQATINLTEIDVPKVKAGNKASVTVDAFPQSSYSGEVISVDTVGTVSSGVTTYPTVIQLDNQYSEILSNMVVTASIITDSKKNVLLVPTSSILSRNGKSIARVRRNGQIQETPVETGLSSDTQTEIVTGLVEGDIVLTSTPVSGTSTQASPQTQSPFSSGLRGGGFGTGNVRINR